MLCARWSKVIWEAAHTIRDNIYLTKINRGPVPTPNGFFLKHFVPRPKGFSPVPKFKYLPVPPSLSTDVSCCG